MNPSRRKFLSGAAALAVTPLLPTAAYSRIQFPPAAVEAVEACLAAEYAITFPAPCANWGRIVAFEIYDPETGTVVCSGTLNTKEDQDQPGDVRESIRFDAARPG